MLTPPRTHWTLPTHTFKVNLQLKLLCAYAHDTYKMRASRDSGATSFATRRMLHGTVHEHTSGGSLSELSPSARFQLVIRCQISWSEHHGERQNVWCNELVDSFEGVTELGQVDQDCIRAGARWPWEVRVRLHRPGRLQAQREHAHAVRRLARAWKVMRGGIAKQRRRHRERSHLVGRRDLSWVGAVRQCGVDTPAWVAGLPALANNMVIGVCR